MEPTIEFTYGVPVFRVVGNSFCTPYPLEFTIKKKRVGLLYASYQILDVYGNMFLQVDGSSRNCQKKRIMRDSAGFPILTMREKPYTLHHRWTVHRGESSDRNDLLFSMQRSSPFQMKSKYDVFLVHNISKDVSNFQVVGCYSTLSAKVYWGDCMVAEAKHTFEWGNYFKGRDDIKVRVNQNVDYAFIVTLIIILTENDQ